MDLTLAIELLRFFCWLFLQLIPVKAWTTRAHGQLESHLKNDSEKALPPLQTCITISDTNLYWTTACKKILLYYFDSYASKYIINMLQSFAYHHLFSLTTPTNYGCKLCHATMFLPHYCSISKKLLFRPRENINSVISTCEVALAQWLCLRWRFSLFSMGFMWKI